jgi:multidrug efflux system outer membrane protein
MKTSMFKPVTRTLLAAAVTTALSACTTVGSDFTAPKGVDAPAYRHAEGTAQASEAARLPAEWWSVFGDATLDGLERRALSWACACCRRKPSWA